MNIDAFTKKLDKKVKTVFKCGKLEFVFHKMEELYYCNQWFDNYYIGMFVFDNVFFNAPARKVIFMYLGREVLRWNYKAFNEVIE